MPHRNTVVTEISVQNFNVQSFSARASSPLFIGHTVYRSSALLVSSRWPLVLVLT